MTNNNNYGICYKWSNPYDLIAVADCKTVLLYLLVNRIKFSYNLYNDNGSPLFNNYLVTIPIFYVIFTSSAADTKNNANELKNKQDNGNLVQAIKQTLIEEYKQVYHQQHCR